MDQSARQHNSTNKLNIPGRNSLSGQAPRHVNPPAKTDQPTDIHPIWPNQTKNLFNKQALAYPGLTSPSEGISASTFAVANKWIANVPLPLVLGPSYSNIELSLTSFTLPSIEMGSDTIPYRGIKFEVPTHVMQPETKEITFNYYVHSDWSDYRALYSWAMNLSPVNKGSISDSSEVVADGMYKVIDITVQLINQMKVPIIGFVFKNCWLKTFSDMQLTYANANEIQHAFTCAYTNFELKDYEGSPEKMRQKLLAEMGQEDQEIAAFRMAAKKEFIERYGQSISKSL